MRNEVISETLISIHETHGKLTPPLVIEEARPAASPIHECFEWDDRKAGHEYRLYQARELIRQVYVTVIEEGKKERQHIFFHTCDADNQPVYHTKEVLVGNIDLLAEAERQAIIKLEIAQRTLEELQRIAKTSTQQNKYKKVKKYVGKALQTMRL